MDIFEELEGREREGGRERERQRERERGREREAMECLIGVVCADCVLLASDTSAVQSIVVLKKDEDKVVKIGDNAAMAIVGPWGDGYVQIGEMNSVCASERASERAHHARGETGGGRSTRVAMHVDCTKS